MQIWKPKISPENTVGKYYDEILREEYRVFYNGTVVSMWMLLWKV